MAKDATPDSIRLVNDNFSNENHEHLAEILLDEWDASTTFTELGDNDDYDAHRATFQMVYNRYFGPGEEDFNDGIKDDRTIEQIKEEFGTYGDYREAREQGFLDVEPGESVTENEMARIQEGYRKGHTDGFSDGWDKALDMAQKKGLENVPRMNEDDE